MATRYIVLGKVSGADGFSPTVRVVKDGKDITITTTDKNGTSTATLTDAGELTAADVGALALSGGTMTGDVTLAMPAALRMAQGDTPLWQWIVDDEQNMTLQNMTGIMVKDVLSVDSVTGVITLFAPLGISNGGTGVASLAALFDALGLTDVARKKETRGTVAVTLPAGTNLVTTDIPVSYSTIWGWTAILNTNSVTVATDGIQVSATCTTSKLSITLTRCVSSSAARTVYVRYVVSGV